MRKTCIIIVLAIAAASAASAEAPPHAPPLGGYTLAAQSASGGDLTLVYQPTSPRSVPPAAPSIPGYGLRHEGRDSTGLLTLLYSVAPVKGPAAGPAPAKAAPAAPVPAAQPPAAQPPAAGNACAVAASETLFLVSTVSDNGTLQPRKWTFQGQTKAGYNCGFWVPPNTAAGTYQLLESDETGARGTVHPVSVSADPYTTVYLPAGADLTKTIGAAPDRTRYLLAAHANYVVTAQPFASQRVQLVGQAGTAITAKPAVAASGDWPELFAVWTTSASAKVGLVNLTFERDTGGRLNSQGKTSTGAAYVSIGSLWAIDCTFNGMDFGVDCDSTPAHGACGVLVQGCQWPYLYAQGVWIGGEQIDVDTCRGGPSSLEHPIRSSIVNLTTNRMPRFVRVAGCEFNANHANATPMSPGKEAGAFRDGRYFFISGNKFVGWVETGQADLNGPWDYFGDYVFDSNEIIDPPTAPRTGTLNVRAGTNGPGRVTRNSAAVPIVVTAQVPPAMAANKP